MKKKRKANGLSVGDGGSSFFGNSVLYLGQVSDLSQSVVRGI